MKLIEVEVNGFRSVKGHVLLPIDSRVTVLLGANDFGKSNVLDAIALLNADAAFEPDDRNWDLGLSEDLPQIAFTFMLEANETESVAKDLEKGLRVAYIDAIIASLEEEFDAASASSNPAPESEGSAGAEELEPEATGSQHVQQHDSPVDLVLAKYEGLAAIREAWLNAMPLDTALQAALDRATAARDAAKRSIRAARLGVAKASKDREAAEGEGNAEALEVADAALTEGHAAQSRAAANLRDVEERIALLQVAQTLADPLWDEAAFRDAHPEISFDSIGRLVVTRSPAGTNYAFPDLGNAPPVTDLSRLEGALPRAVKIPPFIRVPDSVTLDQLKSDEFTFMRGIFHLAGLLETEWPTLFAQNLQTSRRLGLASEQLNKALRETWRQGANLTFILRHDSANQQIQLLIEDPSVANQYIPASRRSSGFTHFFSLKTILHARMTESPAQSYLWLFDEPDVFLHPEAQADLLRVLETLSDANQIVFSTHSIWMINKNHPTRHRLLGKASNGTTLSLKPYSGGWSRALTASGLSLPASVLFASKILLVEGDSDVILIQAVLQKFLDRGQAAFDINDLALWPINDYPSGRETLASLMTAEPVPQVAIVVDGDAGGDAMLAKFKPLCDTWQIAALKLPAVVESILPGAEGLYRKAAVNLAAKITGKSIEVSEDEMAKALEKSEAEEPFARLRSAAGAVAGFDDEVSKVNVAREYAVLLEEYDDEDALARAWSTWDSFFQGLRAALSLPGQTVADVRVFR